MKSFIRRYFWGIVLVVMPLVLWYPVNHDAIHEYKLARDGEITTGVITNVDEDIDEADSGQLIWTSYVTYRFTSQDGQTVTGRDITHTQLKPEVFAQLGSYPIKIRYSPSNPADNSIAKSGQSSFWNLFFGDDSIIWTVVFLMLILCGIYLISHEKRRPTL